MNIKVFQTAVGTAVFAVISTAQTGARLELVPSPPLSELKLPSKQKETAVADGAPKQVGPSVLKLVPPADPIYLVDEPVQDSADEWRTYRRPKVDEFSRNGEGLGIQGYDMVSYSEKRAEKGKKDFSVEYAGVTWQFVTQQHRDEFARNPEQYVPAYGGFCAYSVGKGYPATADPRAFTLQGGKLYLFIDKAVQAVWEQDRRRLISAADRNWPKLHREASSGSMTIK